MDKALAEFAVNLVEIELAHEAPQAVVFKTDMPRNWVTLISIHPDSARRSLQ